MHKMFSAVFVLSALLSCHLNALTLSLEDAERIALRENPLYLAEQEGVYQSKQRALQAISAWLPKLEYTAFFAHTVDPSLVENVDTNTTFYKRNLSSNKFQITQPLLSSDLYFNLQTKHLECTLAKEQEKQQRQALLLLVRKNYYTGVFRQLQVEIEKENVIYLKEALAIEKKRYEGLDAPSLDVTRSAVSSSNAVSVYYRALKNLKQAKNALVESLGIPPNQEPTIGLQERFIPIHTIDLLRKKLDKARGNFQKEPLAFIGAFDQNLGKTLTLFSEKEIATYLQEAVRQFPEVRVKKLAVSVEEKKLHKSYGQYLPVVSSFFDYQKNAGEPASRIFSKDPFNFAAGIEISWNLFDSFSRERKIKEKASKKIAAKLRYKYSVQKVETMLLDILYQIEDAIYQHLHTTSAVFLADKAMQQAREKLLIGKIRPLDYRDTLNELSQAKNLQNMADLQLISSYYELLYLLGRGKDY